MSPGGGQYSGNDSGGCVQGVSQSLVRSLSKVNIASEHPRILLYPGHALCEVKKVRRARTLNLNPQAELSHSWHWSRNSRQASASASTNTPPPPPNTNYTALEQLQQVTDPLIQLVASRKDGQEESVQVRHPARIYSSSHREINAATPPGSTQDQG